MELLILAGGVILGATVTTIMKNRYRTCGVIEIDHSTEQCKFHITRDELSNRRTKKVIFTVNHNAVISQEEQVL